MDESRCAECNDKRFQCFQCKKVDDDTKKAMKESARAAKASAKAGQSQFDRDLAKATKESTKESTRKKKKSPGPPLGPVWFFTGILLFVLLLHDLK